MQKIQDGLSQLLWMIDELTAQAEQSTGFALECNLASLENLRSKQDKISKKIDEIEEILNAPF